MRFARFRAPRRDPTVTLDPARRPKTRAALWRRRLVLVLPALGMVLLHQALFPPHHVVERVRIDVGEIAEQDIRAPFEFSAPRSAAELERLRREAEQKVEPVYRRDPDARRRTELSLRNFFDRAASLAAVDSVPRGERVAELQQLHPGLRATTLRVVLDAERLDRVRAALDTVLASQLDAGVVDVFPRGTYEFVRIAEPGSEEEVLVPARRLFLGYRFEDELLEALRDELPDRSELEAAVDLGTYFLLPNLDFDEARTQRMRIAAQDAVPVERTFARNERIVDRGMRIEREHLDVIEAMEQERFDEQRRQDRTLDQKIRGGRALLLLLVLFGAVRLVRQADPMLVGQTNRYLLLHVLWAMFLALSALTLARPEWGGPVIVPVALLAMLSVIVFGEATAYRVIAAGVLMLAIVPEHAGPMMLAWAAIGVVSVRMLRRVRNRNQFYRALGAVAATAIVVVAAVEFSGAATATTVLQNAGLAVASAAVCTALTLFLLPLLEASFGVTTELTLLELSDLNHPLLRRMSLESPGTFHHSQVVGTLAEAGARAIGANSLLTRVGANFHDIGKMLKPRYFAENQGPENLHDELTPQMSALVIASHVKEGIELGRQWGLPPSVLAFIPEHHGTSVMQFFYKKALEREDGGAIKVDDFRYPGPKPQTRETAILMLADGCEASVRSLRRPTASRVREMVRKIFDQKLAEGELDECGLTVSELAGVRNAFIPILVGIHHQRVAYPGQREHEEKKEQESREARSRSRRGAAPVASNP
ncbi:MAG TPA: HDIG domain-containing protein [Candidatus Krumholzibacteria bacterium]|nr:HDIG domain-containing protein [Candidatus Krumholzibacteria bacterium]